jgi:hypothetical protein
MDTMTKMNRKDRVGIKVIYAAIQSRLFIKNEFSSIIEKDNNPEKAGQQRQY